MNRKEQYLAWALETGLVTHEEVDHEFSGYFINRMFVFAARVRNEALEEAANIVDDEADKYHPASSSHRLFLGLIDNIRALKDDEQ